MNWKFAFSLLHTEQDESVSVKVRIWPWLLNTRRSIQRYRFRHRFVVVLIFSLVPDVGENVRATVALRSVETGVLMAGFQQGF